MTTTTLARTYKLGRAYQAEGWYAYLKDGAYTNEELDALVDALVGAQVEELNRRLPGGCRWVPRLGEIHGPTNINLDGIDLDAALMAAADAVAERFVEIEARVLGTHGA